MAQQPHDNGDRERPHPGAGPAARTPEQDHTPRREEREERERQERRRPQPSAADKAAADKAQAELREAQAANSIGAQIILDYNEDGSKGARGGAGGTIEENTIARDAHLVAIGLDPVAPSGPPPTPEALAARRKREEREAEMAADPQFVAPPNGKATRMSSLAAGIAAEDIPPPDGGVEPPARARA
jgi:hypothetical protein